jgi:hypothetical protein
LNALINEALRQAPPEVGLREPIATIRPWTTQPHSRICKLAATPEEALAHCLPKFIHEHFLLSFACALQNLEEAGQVH